MAGQSGITLVSLIITIVLLLIITGTTVYTSVGRFKINNLKKMYNDIELLDDKIENYYIQYGGLPVLRNDSNEPINYTFRTLEFDKNVNDNENYYIIDLSTIGNITLNYGKEGYENTNSSDDVYIINEKTHTVYYVRGIEYTDGNIYHSKKVDENTNEDNIPPTKPEINIVSGDKIGESQYETNITLEFVPGKDNWSGVSKTTYSINGSIEQNINTLENNQYEITGKGIYEISLKTYDNNNIVSEEKKTIYIGQIKQVEYLESTGTQYIDTNYGIGANKDNLRIVFDAQIISAINGWAVSGIGYLRPFVYVGVNTNDKKIYYGGTTTDENTNIEYSGKRAIFDVDYKEKKLSVMEVENNKKVVDMNIETDSTVLDKNLFLFAYNNYSEAMSHNGKYYSCQIYDNNTLVRDFIPVIDENNVACLYDKVEGKFYYNQGTGEFKTNLNE